MNCNTEIKNVFVSSENRDSNLYPSGNSYVLYLTTPIKDIFKVELIHASVPNTIYNLKDGSNVLTINEGGGATNVFSLTPGFYTGSTLASELTDTLNITYGITVNYLSQFGNFLFTRADTENDYILKANTQEFAKILGFQHDVNYNSQTPPAFASPFVPLYADHDRYDGLKYVQSNIIADFHTNEALFLDIEELRTPLNEDAKSITGNSYSGQNISRSFGMIPLDVNSGTIK